MHLIADFISDFLQKSTAAEWKLCFNIGITQMTFPGCCTLLGSCIKWYIFTDASSITWLLQPHPPQPVAETPCRSFCENGAVRRMTRIERGCSFHYNQHPGDFSLKHLKPPTQTSQSDKKKNFTATYKLTLTKPWKNQTFLCGSTHRVTCSLLHGQLFYKQGFATGRTKCIKTRQRDWQTQRCKDQRSKAPTQNKPTKGGLKERICRWRLKCTNLVDSYHGNNDNFAIWIHGHAEVNVNSALPPMDSC